VSRQTSLQQQHSKQLTEIERPIPLTGVLGPSYAIGKSCAVESKTGDVDIIE